MLVGFQAGPGLREQSPGTAAQDSVTKCQLTSPPSGARASSASRAARENVLFCVLMEVLVDSSQRRYVPFKIKCN